MKKILLILSKSKKRDDFLKNGFNTKGEYYEQKIC